MLLISHAIVLITICTYFRRELIAWVICISLVVYTNRYAFFSPEPDTFYLEYTIYLYTAVQILNACIFLCRNPSRTISLNLILDIFEYLLYPMYSMTLIVLFEDFHKQISTVRSKSKSGNFWMSEASFKYIVFKAVRLIFWFYFIEVFLHFIYANAVMTSPFTLISGLDNYEGKKINGRTIFIKQSLSQ